MKKALSIMLSLMMVLSMLPVAASAESASSELTHVSMLNASVRYSKFIERNGDIPLYVTADTQRLSIQDYLYSAADAILDLANGSRISAAYKALRTIDESTVRENITRGELKRGEYVALAKAVIEAVNSASAVPSCFGTSLGAISPKNTAYVFAQILEYYKGNRTLPSAVEVSPWSGTSYKAPEKAPKAVGTVETTIDIPEVFSAASRVKNRIDSNGILPTITEVDGQNLTMAQFLTTAVDAYLSGKVEGVMAASYANIPEYPVENMSASLTLNKAQIDSLVDAIDKATATTAPASITFEGSVIGFNTLVYAVASILSEIKTNGSIETLTIPSWKDISGTALPAPGTEPTVAPADPAAPRVYPLSSIVSMANRLVAFMSANKMSIEKTYVSLELTKLSDAEAALLLANVVDDLSKLGQNEEYEGSAIYEAAKASDFGSEENFSSGNVSKTEYLAVASAVASYAEANSNLVPETATCSLGTLGFDSITLLLAKAVAAYGETGTLPASIAMDSAWSEGTPSPVKTQSPATTAPATTAPATTAPATTAPATQKPDETQAPDGIFTIAELAAAAKTAVNGYTSGTPFYKEGITVDGITVAQQNYYIIAAQAIQDIYNNKTTATYTNASHKYNVPTLIANYDIKMTSGAEATTASQAFYMNFAIRQTIYVNGSGAGTVGASAAYPTGSGNANGFPVTDYTGQMTYEAGLLMFSRVLAAYADNGSLPNSVALEYVPAVEATDAPATDAPATDAPATDAPATDAPATDAPATDAPDAPSGAYPTQHPAFSTISNGTTFTVADIAAAASQIVSHYETYKELDTEYSMAKAVTVAGQTMTDQDWAYIAGYAINGLSGAWSASGLSGYTASSTVAYKKMGAANKNSNDTYTGTSVTIAKVAEIAWKNMSNFGNINNAVSATCGTAFPGYQVSYYSALLLEARALEYYSTNGSLPATVAYDSVSFVITDSDSYVEAPEATDTPSTTTAPAATPTTTAPATDVPEGAHPTQYPTLSTISNGTTFTVAEIAAAASQIVSHYETYKNLETEYSIAKAVTVAGKTMKDQDWAYLAGYAIAGLSGAWADSGLSGYTASTTVAYKKMNPAGNNANNEISDTTVTIAKVAEIAWKNMSNYGNNNGQVSATCGSALNGQVSYYSALLLEARALEYYSVNGTLPTSVAFDALNFITADSDTYVE